jgi:hypothetical protein
LNPFPGPRRLAVDLNGVPQPDVQLREGRHRYTIEPLSLAPGFNRLRFRSRSAGTVADTIAHNGDRRRLSVQFSTWHWSVDQRPTAAAATR